MSLRLPHKEKTQAIKGNVGNYKMLHSVMMTTTSLLHTSPIFNAFTHRNFQSETLESGTHEITCSRWALASNSYSRVSMVQLSGVTHSS